VKYLGTYKDK